MNSETKHAITADNAKKISEQQSSVELEQIFIAIRKRAAEGKTTLYLEGGLKDEEMKRKQDALFLDFEGYLSMNTVKSLTKLGYVIKTSNLPITDTINYGWVCIYWGGR